MIEFQTKDSTRNQIISTDRNQFQSKQHHTTEPDNVMNGDNGPRNLLGRQRTKEEEEDSDVLYRSINT